MKLLNWNKLFTNLLRSSQQSNSMAFASLFCTESLSPRFSSASPTPSSLLDKILAVRDPKISAVPVLEKWVGDGGAVGKQELQSLVRLMKSFRRFNHALQVLTSSNLSSISNFFTK